MKKLAKTLFMSLVALAATSAIADMSAKLIVFAAENEYYADGITKVYPGEWLALCWSLDGEFDGMRADCKPIDPNERVIRVISWAEEGRCPPIGFFLEGDDVKDSGFYTVLRLDTRTGVGTVASANSNGKPAVVNATVREDFSVDATAGAGGSVEGVLQVGTFDYANTITDDTKAKISKIEANGDGVVLTVINLNPLVKYDIQYGETISELNTATLTFGEAFTGFAGAEFPVSAPKGNFFKLIEVK